MKTEDSPRASLTCDTSSLADPRTAVASAAASINEEKNCNKLSQDVEKVVTPIEYTFPDGGIEAWSVVLGAWLVLFATFGYVNAFGVYQAYYRERLGVSASAISWIGSVQIWLQFSMGLIWGRAFDNGHGRLLLLSGSVLWTLAVFITSICHEYWQVFLVQGVVGGLGLGTMFLSTIGVIPHWFKRRRALATGIVVSGSSVGGLCFPILLNRLLHSIGYAWTVRTAGFLILGCLTIANLLTKPRIPGKKDRPAHLQFPPADVRAIIRHKAYWVTIAGGFLIMWGIFLPFFYLQVFARAHGVDSGLAFYSLSILNGASVLGRVLPNLLADIFGGFNLLIIASTCAGGLVFVLFAATNVSGVVCFAIFYGFFSGAFVSLMPGCITSLSSHVGETGVRMGIAWAVIALAALTGTPIDGALLGSQPSEQAQWWKPVTFSGVSIIAGACMISVARTMQARRMNSRCV